MRAPLVSVEILVTDDDDATRGLYRDVLRFRGYGVREARTGEECLRHARERPPALIILDLQMPVLNGFAAARELRAHPETASIPILAVSGVSQPAEIERALRAGCDVVLNKPIAPQELLGGVHALVDRYEAERVRAQAEQQRQAAAALVRTSYSDLRALWAPSEEVGEIQLRQWMQGAQVSICSYCARVRLTTGEWQSITRELTEFLERWTTLSHGVCPECLAREHPDAVGRGSPS
jgi:two-component system, cell cycle response regulator DivK